MGGGLDSIEWNRMGAGLLGLKYKRKINGKNLLHQQIVEEQIFYTGSFLLSVDTDQYCSMRYYINLFV